MKRTIEVKSCDMYYRGKEYAFLNDSLCTHFKIWDGKFVITINLGKNYRFEASRNSHTEDRKDRNVFDKNGIRCGFVCEKLFTKLFFKPNARKRYDITVTRVKGGNNQ